MTPEDIQLIVVVTVGMLGALWAGHAIGYMRGYRQATKAYQDFEDLSEVELDSVIDQARDLGVASAPFQRAGESHG